MHLRRFATATAFAFVTCAAASSQEPEKAVGVLTDTDIARAAATPLSPPAEIYMGIRPFDTLADVKKLFPNATFKDLKPAWAKPSDRLMSISGPGISGTIIVLFYEHRMSDRGKSQHPDLPTINKMLGETDDVALEVEWVRWSPISPGVPLARLVSKYGAVFEKGYDASDFQPFRQWKAAGVLAVLSDDEKTVIGVDFTFTPEERCVTAKAKKLDQLIVGLYCGSIK